MAKKEPNFALIRPQKADFVQILLLFRARYCLYDQAGSFPSTFIESRESLETLSKHFFSMGTIGTQGRANRVTFLPQIFTMNYVVKNFKLDCLKKTLPKTFETQALN